MKIPVGMKTVIVGGEKTQEFTYAECNEEIFSEAVAALLSPLSLGVFAEKGGGE